MQVIRRLCAFEGRRAGTDAERRAASYLAGELRDGGRDAEIEPTYVHPQFALAHAVHCGLGIAASIVALRAPAVGFAIVLATAASMYLDLNTRFYLVRSLFFRRASQNVVSRGDRRDAPARVVLCAHYDAGPTGRVFAPRTVRRAGRIQSRLPFPIGPFRIAFWSLAALLPILGARMAGFDPTWLSAVQLVPTLTLVVVVFALVDVALSDVVPGANDNASGVATVLGLARELDREQPEHLDVWVLLTGAEECLEEGMRAFVRDHRSELPRESTYFVCVDAVGYGEVRFETAAGWAISLPMSPRLMELCEALTDGLDARPLKRGVAGDSIAARVRRYSATTITCTTEIDFLPGLHTLDDVPENLQPEALERAHEFTLALVRLLDRDVGRRTALV
jgi:hypothetical protein